MAQIKITLKKSLIGSTDKMRQNARSLGLKKTNSSVVQNDTPEIRGMVRVIRHLVTVEEVNA